MTTRHQDRRSLLAAAGAALAAAAAVALGSCAGPAPEADAAAARQERVAPAGDTHRRWAAGTGTPACTGANAHERHLALFACDTCHAAGGTYAFGTSFAPFPRGTTTAGGTIAKGTATTATTCTVACHFPMGGAPRAVSWNAAAPLECTACHDTSTLAPAHPPVAANAPRAVCAGCHAAGTHLSGAVPALAHPAGWVDPASASFHALAANRGLVACQACHGPDLAGGTTGVACARCHDANLPAGVASWRASCTMCHGGANDASGAPPKALWGFAGDPARGGGTADPVRVGAHAKHLATSALSPPIACDTCHAVPSDALSAGHVDATAGDPVATVTFGGAAAAGGATPSWSRAGATCSNVYCHGATLNAGGAVTAPSWTGGPAQAACGTCHGAPPPAPHPAASGLASCAGCHPQTMDAAGQVIPPSAGGLHLDGLLQVIAGAGHPAGWLDPASTSFHAFAANAGLGSCQGCHGANLDGLGGSATTSCATCHGASWRTSCTMCHGGASDQSGAPPAATWGHAGDPARGGGLADPVRVGAHARHVTAGALSAPIPCATCHATPADALSPGHVDGPTATVTFTGAAAANGASPSWTRATATCAGTACHGGYSGGFTYFFFDAYYTVPYAGSGAAPAWTGGGPMTCTSCHANPPPTGTWHSSAHGGALVPGGGACSLCHPGVDAAGTAFTDPTSHVNGAVDVNPVWTSKCQYCH